MKKGPSKKQTETTTSTTKTSNDLFAQLCSNTASATDTTNIVKEHPHMTDEEFARISGPLSEMMLHNSKTGLSTLRWRVFYSSWDTWPSNSSNKEEVL